MANSLLTISMITREALMVLENNLVFAKNVEREYDDQFAVGGAKIGDTINIRKPPRYIGRTGATLAIEDATETSVPLQLATQAGVDIAFTSKDLTLSIDDFQKRFIVPAIANIANKIDFDGLSLYKNVPNAVGTPGTTPSAFVTYLSAGALLDMNSAPRDGQRAVVIDPNAQVSIVDALKGLFQSSEKISDQYENGTMGLAGGMKFSMDQNVVTHTVGALGGTPLVNGAAQTGSSLITNGWTAAVALRLKKGDVFTIAAVNGVNPQSKQSTGKLQQFVVTADSSSDVAGNMTIPIFPAIVGPSPASGFQTVDVLPASGAAITVLGAANTLSPANLLYHKSAFALGCADLILPGGVDMASRAVNKKTGLSIRMVRAYDITNDRFPCRLDVLYGYAALYPQLACRIMG